ncbi:MAG: discoidin domain-containing protein, partial [Spirochaetota bacterium]
DLQSALEAQNLTFGSLIFKERNYQYLLRLGIAKILAFTIVLLIALLPGFQSGIFWASAAPLFVGLLLAIVAGITVQVSLEQKRVNLSLLLVSFVLLTGSLFIHPAWAMVFFAPFIAFLLFVEKKQIPTILHTTIVNYTVFALACISYFVLHKFVLLKWTFQTYPHLIKSYQELSIYKFELSSNPILKLVQLLTNEFSKVFGLWDIYQEGWGADTLILVFFLSSILFVLKKTVNQQFTIRELKQIILIAIVYIATFIATLTPYVLAKGGHSMFRMVLPTAIILVLLFLKHIEWIANHFLEKKQWRNPNLVLGYTSIILLLLGLGYTTHRTIQKSAENSLTEFLFVKSLLLNHVNRFGLPSHVHVIQYTGNKGFNGLPIIGDTINFNSTSTANNIPWIVRAALMPLFRDKDRSLLQVAPVGLEEFDTHHSLKSNKIIVTSSTGMPPTSKVSPDTLLIDMHNMVIHDTTINAHPVSSSQYGIYKAFDKSTNPNDFWEASILQPITLDIKYPKFKVLATYKFSSGELASRMPSTWKLFASKDQKNWVLVDTQKNFTDWSVNESRQFSLVKQQTARYYRFVFEKALHHDVMRIYEIELIQ